MDKLLIKSNGNSKIIENELRLPNGTYKNVELVRIDINNPMELKLRMPSGNETGANSYWIPGGKIPTGYLEAVIDPIPAGKYSETTIILK